MCNRVRTGLWLLSGLLARMIPGSSRDGRRADTRASRGHDRQGRNTKIARCGPCAFRHAVVALASAVRPRRPHGAASHLGTYTSCSSWPCLTHAAHVQSAERAGSPFEGRAARGLARLVGACRRVRLRAFRVGRVRIVDARRIIGVEQHRAAAMALIVNPARVCSDGRRARAVVSGRRRSGWRGLCRGGAGGAGAADGAASSQYSFPASYSSRFMSCSLIAFFLRPRAGRLSAASHARGRNVCAAAAASVQARSGSSTLLDRSMSGQTAKSTSSVEERDMAM